MSVHQQWINQIGNNLANSNTPGYKTTRTTFAGSLVQTLSAASGPVAGSGGKNPIEVGLGVILGTTARNFTQGALTQTGRVFDLALDGTGFFALTDGTQRYYTRVGTFGLDREGSLVDQRTGYNVLDPLGQSLKINTNGLLPPQATSEVGFSGNLPAVVTGPLAEVLTGLNGMKEGFPATLTSTNNPIPAVAPGSTYTLELEIDGASPQQVSVTDAGGGAITAAEIASAIDAVSGVTAAVNGGFIDIRTSRTGESISLKINPGSGNDLAALAGFSTGLVTGSETDIDPMTTDLNSLPANVVDYQDGDQILITGVDTDGTAINETFTYGAANDGTTVQEFVDHIAGFFNDAQVSLNASGQFVVAAQTAGETDLLLSFGDGTPGLKTEWATYGLGVSTEGTKPDVVTTSTEVYDSVGSAHTLTLSFERQADLSWTLTASIPEEEGTVDSAPITGIKFNDDGAPEGIGLVENTVSVSFTGQDLRQTVDIGLGVDGQFDSITQFGGQTTAFVQFQDGYGDGQLANVAVNGDGNIEGNYTNGQTRVLGTVGLATFTNPEGLSEARSNLWVRTGNSGEPVLSEASNGNGGRIVGGMLENSNVDTAEQFVRLIEAQRGFQANARVITTQDEVLAEVVNLI